LYEEVVGEVDKLNAVRKEQDRRQVHNRCKCRKYRAWIRRECR
jgi:hypothetical protein